MASSSRHPVSESIVQALRGEGFRFLADLEVREVPGRGLLAVHDGAELRLGSHSFAFDEAQRAGDRGMCLLVRDAEVTEACFAIEEDVRAGFAAEIGSLTADGTAVFIMSGDGQDRVDDVARRLGVPRGRAYGGLSPDAKARLIRALDADDTMMVGDGINDAPAFDAATCAGAAALDRPVMPARADFFFLGGGSTAVRQVLQAAVGLHRVVVGNLWLAAAYNLVALTLCLAGQMTPLLCAVLMPLSSLVLIWHTVARLRVAAPTRAVGGPS
jgi:Cu2+-exporting ATPase